MKHFQRSSWLSHVEDGEANGRSGEAAAAKRRTSKKNRGDGRWPMADGRDGGKRERETKVGEHDLLLSVRRIILLRLQEAVGQLMNRGIGAREKDGSGLGYWTVEMAQPCDVLSPPRVQGHRHSGDSGASNSNDFSAPRKG